MNFKRFTSPRVLKRQTAGGGLKGRGNKFTSRKIPRPGPPLSFPRCSRLCVERGSPGPGLCQACPALGGAAALALSPPAGAGRGGAGGREAEARTGRTACTAVPGPAHATAWAHRPEGDSRIVTNAVRRPAPLG